MKATVYLEDFVQAFKKMGRAEQFSYAALRALYDFYTEYEEGSGVEVELDVIAICCDWTEYSKEEVALSPDGYEVIEIDNSYLVSSGVDIEEYEG